VKRAVESRYDPTAEANAESNLGSDPVATRTSGTFTRLLRVAARGLLWGCVLLLLVRGIASYFDTTSRVPTTTRGVTVTVTQPVHTETSQAQGK
jgi:hypothetical protein